MKALRKSIIACGVSMLLCLGLLIGTTFAWFTDSITNSGNTITAGKLAIDVQAFDVDMDNTASGMQVTVLDQPNGTAVALVNGGNPIYFESVGQNLKTDETPIITEENWEPGQSSAKLLQVENTGSLNAKVTLGFTTWGDLTDALWFDFIGYSFATNTGTQSGAFTQRSMSTLSSITANRVISMQPGDMIYFVLVYGMYENAGNAYQGASFTASVSVNASQDTGESDGFGNPNYDAGAFKEVSDATSLEAAVAAGQTAVLTNDIEVAAIPVAEEGETNINLNGNTLTTTQDAPKMIENGAALNISNGSIIAEGITAASRPAIRVEEGSSVTLTSVTFTTTGVALFPRGNAAEVNVINSVITAPNAYCIGTNAGNESNYNVEINVSGSTLKGATPVLINVPCKLNISNSEINGVFQGIFVRGGEATIINTTITMTGKANDYYLDRPWGQGNNAAVAALVIGNRNADSYQYNATVELIGCTISTNTEGCDIRPIYLYGNDSAENGATLTYDNATEINEGMVPDTNDDVTFVYNDSNKIYVGGGYVTINGTQVSPVVTL